MSGGELEQELQPLDALIRQHDRAYAEQLREQQQPEPQKKPARYYAPLDVTALTELKLSVLCTPSGTGDSCELRD